MVANVNFDKNIVGTPVLDSAGDTVTYSFAIEHQGGENITSMAFTDTLLGLNAIDLLAAISAGDVVLGGDDGDNVFEVGETWTFTEAATSDIFTYTLTQADLDSNGTAEPGDIFNEPGQMDNLATLRTFNANGQQSFSIETEGALLTRTPSLNIVKDVSSVTGGTGGAADSAGDVINYAITVANTGNVTLTGVTVTDPFADLGSIVRNAVDVVGDEDNLLEVGEIWGFTAAHTVTQAEIDAGGNFDGPDADSLFDQLRNVATADSNETGPDTDDASVPVARTPSLNIVKDVSSVTGGTGGAADSAGDVINYAITVANTGNVTLTGVTVTDPFADLGSIVRNAVDVVGDEDNLLEVGEIWGFTAAHTVTQAEIDAGGNFDGPDADSLFDQLRNVATANSNETGPDTDDASVPVARTPSLNIVKDVSSVTGGTGGAANSAGDVINYAITVANTGNVTLTGVTVTDPFADLGSIVRNAVDVVGDEDNLLEVGEIWGFTAAHTVTQAEIDAGGNFDGPDADSLFDQLRNVATADSNETGPDTDDASVPVARTPSLNIVKDVSSVTGGTGGAANSAGDVINYAITVANTGNVTLTGVTVTDPFADLGSIVRNAVDVVGDEDNLLEVGEIWGFTAAHTVTQAEIDAGGNFDGPDADSLFDQLRNVATADSNETGPDTDDASVPVARTPSLNIVKDVSSVTGGTGGAADSAGDVINYAITVANTGNVTLTGVTVTDPFADLGSIVRNAVDVVGDEDNLLEVGEIWGFTAAHTVTQAEIDAGGNFDGPDADSLFDQLRNVATADSNETGPDTDDASVPVARTPSLNIVKDVSSVTGGTGGAADSAGDVINYAITVANTGNVTLTGVTVTDPFADLGSIVRNAVDVVGDEDNLLEVGEIWGFTAAHTVTQAEIDAGGNFDGPDADSLFDQLRNVATADSNETGPDTDDASVPVARTPSLNIVKDVSSVTGGTGGAANSAGDVINYAITVANTGNVTLTGVTVTDPFADLGSIVRNAVDVVGDEDNLLEVGEIWGFTAAHTVTQAEIDAGGNFDGPDADSLFDQLRNVATADSNETGPDTDDASVPVARTPSLNIVKDVSSVTGGTGGAADSAGDVINYAITVANTGNVTLTGVTVTDPFADLGSIVRNAVDVVGDEDNLLEVGEIWGFTAAHTVTQAEIDAGGNFDGPDADSLFDQLRNVATADSNETGPDTDDASVPVARTPSLNIVKDVSSVTGGTGGAADSAGDVINYAITVANTGNVTLTGVTVTDPFADLGSIVRNAVDVVGDEDNLLEVGEIWGFTAAHTVTQAEIDAGGNFDGPDADSLFDQLRNVATADSNETGPDTDDASVPVVQPAPGPGVRTPGFWQNPNNGGQFWDGIVGNEDHAGEPGFPEGELLYAVDSDCDGDLDPGTLGLLIGDYDQDGLTDMGEDTLFISLADAQALVGSGGGSDGVEKIGRDVVATWLNFLAGNNIDNPGTGDDLVNPQHFIDDAIDWLQVYGDASPLNINDPSEDCDVYSASHTAVKSSSAAWNDDGFLDHSASEIHSALDQYNNTGFIGLIGYAPDAM